MNKDVRAMLASNAQALKASMEAGVRAAGCGH